MGLVSGWLGVFGAGLWCVSSWFKVGLGLVYSVWAGLMQVSGPISGRLGFSIREVFFWYKTCFGLVECMFGLGFG